MRTVCKHNPHNAEELSRPFNEAQLVRLEMICAVAFRPYMDPHTETWTYEGNEAGPLAVYHPTGCHECDSEYLARKRSCIIAAHELDKNMIPRLLATIRALQNKELSRCTAKST